MDTKRYYDLIDEEMKNLKIWESDHSVGKPFELASCIERLALSLQEQAFELKSSPTTEFEKKLIEKELAENLVQIGAFSRVMLDSLK